MNMFESTLNIKMNINVVDNNAFVLPSLEVVILLVLT
jgi:hypothetical protein